MKLWLAGGVASWVLLCCGCASSGAAKCTVEGFQFLVTSSAVVNPDHAAMPPGNQQQFTAGLGSTYGPGCVSNQLVRKVAATWTASDPANVSISSADDATNGLATCLGSSESSVSASLTADGFAETRTAPIVCR